MELMLGVNFLIMRSLVEYILRNPETQALVQMSDQWQVQHSPSNEKQMLALFRMPQLLENDPKWYPLTRVMTASTASYTPHTPRPNADLQRPL